MSYQIDGGRWYGGNVGGAVNAICVGTRSVSSVRVRNKRCVSSQRVRSDEHLLHFVFYRIWFKRAAWNFYCIFESLSDTREEGTHALVVHSAHCRSYIVLDARETVPTSTRCERRSLALSSPIHTHTRSKNSWTVHGVRCILKNYRRFNLIFWTC